MTKADTLADIDTAETQQINRRQRVAKVARKATTVVGVGAGLVIGAGAMPEDTLPYEVGKQLPVAEGLVERIHDATHPDDSGVPDDLVRMHPGAEALERGNQVQQEGASLKLPENPADLIIAVEDPGRQPGTPEDQSRRQYPQT
ncbi:MAG TPA: hypothetical protein VK674_01285 [Candidatus Limnocylindria bacterium]|nr:hypothetical protein [Candidatus Limnocylindria bacterium]